MELKECPFCGGTASIVVVTRHVEDNRIVVKCDRCGASTKTFHEARTEKAADAWNRRAEE